MNIRIEKINDLIRQHINDIFTRELNLKPGVFITISKVDTAADLRYTRIFISAFPEREIEYAKRTLEKEVFKIQGRLNKMLGTRPLPKIEFKFDMTESRADEIEKILKTISGE